MAHVLTAILHLDAANDQRPGVEVVVRHRESIVVRDDVLVDGQYRFGVRLDPGHLLANCKFRLRIAGGCLGKVVENCLFTGQEWE